MEYARHDRDNFFRGKRLAYVYDEHKVLEQNAYLQLPELCSSIIDHTSSLTSQYSLVFSRRNVPHQPDDKSLQTNEGHGQSLAPRMSSPRTAVISRPSVKMVNAIVSEAMAMAVAAAAAEAAGTPASPRTASRGGGAVRVSSRMNSGVSTPYGLHRAQQEYNRIVAEAAVSPNTAAASAHYNHEGWAQHAFRLADEKYAGVRKLYGTVEGQWIETSRSLQAAARGVPVPKADLKETYRLYMYAENHFRTGEALVKSAEAREKRSKEELARTTEALEVAVRAVVRAEVTLCDFDRSYFSPVGRRDEHHASAGAGIHKKTGDEFVRQEEGRQMKQDRARGSRGYDSVPPQDFVLPTAVGTKSWTALRGAQPVHAGEQGGVAGAMDVDSENFRQLAQALLGDSEREENEPLQNCDAGAAVNVRRPMKTGTTCESKYEELSGGPEGAVPATRGNETQLDKEKYLRRLANTLQNTRQNLCEATAQRNRAQLEVDRAMVLVGARTVGDWSFAAERRANAVKAYLKARAVAAPVLRAVVKQAKAFKHAEELRVIAWLNLNLAWEARESARLRLDPRTGALFAAAAAAADASSPTPSHGAAHRVNAFHEGEVSRTAVGGTQRVMSAGSAEQVGWRGGAPGQVLRSPRGG